MSKVLVVIAAFVGGVVLANSCSSNAGHSVGQVWGVTITWALLCGVAAAGLATRLRAK